MEPRAIFPVPFRWFYYLATTVYRSKKSKEQNTLKQKKYFCLLRELILSNQAAILDMSIEDKISDLRQDILNELRNELRKLKDVK